MKKKKKRRMYIRIESGGGGGDPVGIRNQNKVGKGLLPPLFKILASLSLLTTIMFIVWGWTKVSRSPEEEEERKNPQRIHYFPNNYSSSETMRNDSRSENYDFDSLFTERKDYSRETCMGIINQRLHGDQTPPTTRNAFQGIEKQNKNILTTTTTKNGMNRRNWIFIPRKASGQVGMIEWCPIYKAASSPWMALFGKLSSILTPRTEKLIRTGKLTFIKLFKDFRMNVPKVVSGDGGNGGGGGTRSVRMVIVRHPFERLLSAYRDKLENIQGREFYYRKYGYRILAQFRYSNQSNPRNPTDTFHSTLSKVLEWRNVVRMLMENGTTSPLSPTTGQERPTFNEFVQYLLSVDVRSMDEHWRPMYLDCNPCQYPFDLILKVETMDRDRGLVFNLLGFGSNGGQEEMNRVWNRWTNRGKAYPKDKKTRHEEKGRGESLAPGESVREAYFSTVRKSDLKLLYEKYKMDFLLFNYDPTPYFLMGQ